MAKPRPTYDLVLLLDTSAEADRRKTILSDVETSIREGGEVLGTRDWGVRPTTFEIDHKAEAEYHLLQFHGGPELLSQLQRTLRITDGVTRFRIIKLAPGTPPVAEGPLPASLGTEEPAAPVAV